MAHLAQHRGEKAAFPLHTDRPITQIGQAVGWADRNYFACRSKARYGLTAAAHRRRFRHRSVRL